jgi:hypothetical protein
MYHSWPEDAFQGRVDAGEQAADAVAQAGSLSGQVIVEPDQHPEFGQGVIADIDPGAGCAAASGRRRR